MAQLSRVTLNKFDESDGRSREIGNLILRALPRSESVRIFSSLEFVRLKLHQVLHETAEVIRSGYFLNDGMSSVLTVQPDGESVEVGLIGREGFVGLPVIFGFKTSALRIITQEMEPPIASMSRPCAACCRNAPCLSGSCNAIP